MILFCYLYDIYYKNKGKRDVYVYRVIVELNPSPYPENELLSVVTIQPYWKTDGNNEQRNYLLLGSARMFKNLVGVARLKSWLRLCEGQHGKTCHPPDGMGDVSQPEFLKLIDVKRKCIVSAPPNCRYLALSYIWGQGLKFSKSTEDNIEQLRREFALERLDLPKTIVNSMTLVETLGERYLWVDALVTLFDLVL